MPAHIGFQRCSCIRPSYTPHTFRRPQPTLPNTRSLSFSLKVIDSKSELISRTPLEGSISTLGTAAWRIYQSRGHNTQYRVSIFNPTYGSSSCTTPFSAVNPTSRRAFSSTSSAMTATKIDGTAIAKKVREQLHAQIEATQKINSRYKPSLKIVQGIFCDQLDSI
jgi:hypothetical protein